MRTLLFASSLKIENAPLNKFCVIFSRLILLNVDSRNEKTCKHTHLFFRDDTKNLLSALLRLLKMALIKSY